MDICIYIMASRTTQSNYLPSRVTVEQNSPFSDARRVRDLGGVLLPVESEFDSGRE